MLATFRYFGFEISVSHAALADPLQMMDALEFLVLRNTFWVVPAALPNYGAQ